ncbi:MAG: metalloregulator ArsR/SmtB family transcription factor [Bryobacterales bacterium]|nr:metalloregulator ArsR/SmtB family transcription factor [Bryobacteraceae bacterium]MDW8131320.1 metalloregulator ArsR/SmtB family transcription factor [Bryobacterales bacterium]
MDRARLARRFRALADPNRLRILELLLRGERCGCEIQVALGLTQSNVSRHLSCLRNAGLIAEERRGRRVFYRLAAEGPGCDPLVEFVRAVLRAKRPRRAAQPGAAVRLRRLRLRRGS